MAASPRIDELRRKFEDNPRRYFAPLANEYRKAGDAETAIAICRRHLDTFPGHISGHIVLGQSLYEVGRLSEARQVFETALGVDPENLIALRHLGDIARSQGNDPAARRWYERILEVDPRNEDIAAQLAALAPPAPAPAELVTGPVDAIAASGPISSIGGGRGAPESVGDDRFGLLDAEFEASFGPGVVPPDANDARTPGAPEAEGERPAEPAPPGIASDADVDVDVDVDEYAAGPQVDGVAEPEPEEHLDAFVDGWELPTLEGSADGAAPVQDSAADEPPGSDEAPAAAGHAEASPAGVAWGHTEPAPSAADVGADDAAEDPDRRADAEPWAVAAHVEADRASATGVAAGPDGEPGEDREPMSDPARAPAAEGWDADPGEPFDPVVGLDLPPTTDGASLQLAAAGDFGGATGSGTTDEPVPIESLLADSAERPDAEPRAEPLAEPLLESSVPAAAGREPVGDDARVGSDELAALASGAFATETLAELFVRQGHVQQAVSVYERLVAERPDDATLSARLRDLRGPDEPTWLADDAGGADEPATSSTGPDPATLEEVGDAIDAAFEQTDPADVPSIADAATGPPADAEPVTAHVFFAALASRVVAPAEHAAGAAGPAGAPAADRADRADPLLSGDALAPAPDERAAAVLAGAFGWADAAGGALLDELAAASNAPLGDATSDAVVPAAPDLSFDRFFAGFEDLLHAPPTAASADAGSVEDATATPALAPPLAEGGFGVPVPGDAGASGDEDLAEFNAWLRGLGDQ